MVAEKQKNSGSEQSVRVKPTSVPVERRHIICVWMAVNGIIDVVISCTGHRKKNKQTQYDDTIVTIIIKTTQQQVTRLMHTMVLTE